MAATTHRRPSACRRALWAGLVVTVALTGCASALRVDSEVESHAHWVAHSQPPKGNGGQSAVTPRVAQAGDTYRLDTTPAQQGAMNGLEPAQTALHAALQGLGLAPGTEGGAVDWAIQWQVRSERVASPHADAEWPWGPWPGRDYLVTGQGEVVWLPRFDWPVPRWSRLEVQLWLRPAAGGPVVYETRAVHQGPWAPSARLWQSVWQAALSGFPQPPAGPRTVWVETPPRP